MNTTTDIQFERDEMEMERDFWRQTAVELYGQCAPQNAVEEHLSDTQIARLEAALNDNVEPVKLATLFWITENGERHKLAGQTFLLHENDDTIRQYMIGRYWEDRLDSASCSAVVEIEEVE